MANNFTINFLPHREICAINHKYVSEDNTLYYLKSKGLIFYKYYIEDSKNQEIFNCKYGIFTGSLEDPKTNKVLYKFNNKLHIGRPFELIISCFENDKEFNSIICKVKSKLAFLQFKYEVEFFNKALQKDEILEVNCSPQYKDCSIFYGRKDENGVLICKFDSSKFFTGVDFKIQISRKVDTIFILILVNAIYRLIQRQKSSHAA
ncbi:hypothetical protein BCR32DRAFT_291426 [Anaeromyces robustus]|uniref:Tubby C-terminal domain-containing protein n=1 Tax=Anaeromyces robustus TaxID=1754192 RepID=A0A1Y1XEU8_9FUNG|nr:hypothetical protein BCR32DRAFT_291426 [Anaeromyces robustus]|eukprot:ORX84278.1 hypothetical protein BCR32DRAFT_291426 [Anaeromyces robustus]